MPWFARLLSVAVFLLLTGCHDQAGDPVQPDASRNPALGAGGDGGEVPPRSVDGTPWQEMTDQELWDYIAELDTTVVVGVKAPGRARGIWRDRVLLTAAERVSARAVIEGIAGIIVLNESESLPMLEVRVPSLQALSVLRNLPVADYVEPAIMEIGLAGTFGCSYPQWSGSAGTTFAGDIMLAVAICENRSSVATRVGSRRPPSRVPSPSCPEKLLPQQ